ncbi:hypothetical protein C0991_006750 [Blastosporella zonata]|nr:hypothetical protein C0991_006750 [Blastosporella zonata]
MVGYSTNGYRLFNRNSRTIISSRNVIFEEGIGHRSLTVLDDKNGDLLASTTPIPNPAIPGIPTPDCPIAPRIRTTDPPLHPPRDNKTSEQHTLAPQHDDLPLALRRTPRSVKATPALTAAQTTLATEAKARAAEEEWATSDEPHQALTTLTKSETSAYLASMNANIDKSSDSYIPRHYGKALQRLDLWKEPMETELDVLEKRKVWKLVDETSVPADKKVINCMWVYANKYDADGNIVKCKA